MKIDITKEQYRDLLDLLYIAEWVLIAHKTEEDPRTRPYDKVIEKLYSHAAEAGYERLIERDPATRSHYTTREFEEASKAILFIDEFVDDSFWDELIIRLAERDAAQQGGGYDRFRLLSHDEQHALRAPLEDRYSEEFNSHGVDHVVVAHQFGIDLTTPVKTSD
jgi:hypothetical protein